MSSYLTFRDPYKYARLPHTVETDIGRGQDQNAPITTFSNLSPCLRGMWRRVRRLCLLRHSSSISILASVGLKVLPIVLIITVLCIAYGSPYRNEPPHFQTLRGAVQASKAEGRGNRFGERIFIASNIINGDLIRGPWGASLKELIGLLGDDNVFLSIYENDSPPDTDNALKRFGQELSCNHSIVTGVHLDLKSLPQVRLSTGEERVKRITYMAEVRNQALRPLDPPSLHAHETLPPGFQYATGTFDRVLFLNDVYFSAVDALQLLFSTNIQEGGRAKYQAACAADFVSVTNYYDSFATRDLEGFELAYGPGLRYYPWFSTAGKGQSRRDVMAGKDAVRVRSCWGGMVALEAKWFQQLDQNGRPAVRFRSEPEAYWEASECCLIHADMTALAHPSNEQQQFGMDDVGIYINPFVRVAYKPTTFKWLRRLRAIEGILAPIQRSLTWWHQYPLKNERRTDIPGQSVKHKVWTSTSSSTSGLSQTNTASNGEFKLIEKRATPGGFCGIRAMLVMKDNLKESNKKDNGNWESAPPPEL